MTNSRTRTVKPWESQNAGYRVAQPNSGESCQDIVHQTRNPSVRDLRSHDVGNSRVKSTMEMRLSHFIDPTHQGGHPHGGFFGNGKL